MICSMTGFASTSTTLSRGNESSTTVALSLKSLNSRYFEATCRMPYPLAHLETTFIQKFKKHFIRGHIYFTVHLSDPAAFKEVVAPSLHTIETYLSSIQKIKKNTDIAGELTLQTLLQLPNVLQIQEQDIDEQSKKIILRATDELITMVCAAREQEGAELARDFVQRTTTIQHEIDIIEKAAGNLVNEQKTKVHTVLQEIEQDENKLADARKNALYAILDKIDIHEEIVRFKSHLNNLKKQLDSPEKEKGKRLDFTLQELAREINTISAKCSDATIGSHAINIKVEIEKAREQAQNIV